MGLFNWNKPKTPPKAPVAPARPAPVAQPPVAAQPAPAPVVRDVKPPPAIITAPPPPVDSKFVPVPPETFYGNPNHKGRMLWGVAPSFQVNRNVERALNGDKLENWALMTSPDGKMFDRYECMPGQDIGYSGDVGIRPPKDRDQQSALFDLEWDTPYSLSVDVKQTYPGRSRAAWCSILDKHEAWHSPAERVSLPAASTAINRAPDMAGGDGKLAVFLYNSADIPHNIQNEGWLAGSIFFDPTAIMRLHYEFMFSTTTRGYYRTWLHNELFVSYVGRLGAAKPPGVKAAHINEGIYQEDAQDPFGIIIGNRRLAPVALNPWRGDMLDFPA